MFKEATRNEEVGIKLGRQVISTISYADHKVVIASIEESTKVNGQH